MKTIFWLLVALFFIIYSSEPTITFKPFSIEFIKNRTKKTTKTENHD